MLLKNVVGNVINTTFFSFSQITFGDKSSIDVLSKFINNFVQKEWGCMQLCNIIVVSDGRLSMNQDFLNASSLNTVRVFFFAVHT